MAKSSKDYWREREEENLKRYLLEEEEYTKRLHEILNYTADQIQLQINGFYSKYADKEGITMAEAKRRVKQLDIDEYARKAKKYVAEKNFSKQANDEMRLYNATMKINRLELLKANIGLELTAGYDDLQKELEKDLTQRTLEELKRQAGILGEALLDNEKTANAIVNASFRNATFSDRIWMYQGMMRSELDKLLQQGLIQGQHPDQLATHLYRLFGVSRYNAERLMRTEMARVQIEAQKQSFERNGYEEYIFLALGTACDVCKGLNEQHFKVKDMMPGENAPPMHPNCRCSTAAYMDRSQIEKQNAQEERQLKKDLQVFARDSKSAIIDKISNNQIDKARFDSCLKYFENKFEKGIYTPIGMVYDNKNAFYHIVDRHEYMMDESNIDRIVNTLSTPKEIFKSKDRMGTYAKAYIEDNTENTLVVIVRENIITAYEPSKNYLKKLVRGERVWKKP